jgi:hypothetical protein
MDFLEPIRDQIEAVGLPLYAITLTAVPRPDTPLLLMLHWHGFRRDFLLEAPEAAPVALRSVPASALQLNERWRELQTIDFAAMEAGWELGAWELRRRRRPACLRPGADTREAIECLQAFGSYPESMGGTDLVVAEAPDGDELLRLGAAVGYVTWQFRPVCGGIWAEVADDATLSPDGSREPPCPLAPEPPPDDRAGSTVYCFGRAESILLN